MVSVNLVSPYYLLFLPAMSGERILPGYPAFVNRKINGGNQPFISVRTPAGAPGPQLTKYKNPRKLVFFIGSLGVSVNGQRSPGANLSTGYPQLLWITFVEFGSFS